LSSLSSPAMGKPGQCGLLLGLPLAICIILSAPAPTVTSSMVLKDETPGDAGLAAKILEHAKPSSAVQDWSLLCKELCGAGLGVASTPGEAKDAILRPEFDVSKCRQQCGLPKGGWGDVVCSSFCRKRNRSLPGCSPCQQEVHGTQEENDARKEEEMKMARGVQRESAHGSGSETPPKTVDVVALAATDTTTASPDWDEVCKVLCKTGDGGSLCNCDLSPFFS
ncbi:hypothetical protein KR009_007349, partial [Drosophila setifemur]